MWRLANESGCFKSTAMSHDPRVGPGWRRVHITNVRGGGPRDREHRRSGYRRAALLRLVLKHLLIAGGIHQGIEWLRIRGFHLDDPPGLIGILIHRLRGIHQRLVDLGHLSAHRGEELGNGLGGFDHSEWAAGSDCVSYL